MRRTTAVASVAAACLTALAVASPASAQSPWWHLTSGARPTNLQPGLAKNAVQANTTSPEVAFELMVKEKKVGLFVTEPFFKEFGGAFPEATAANLQKALEGVEAYGDGAIVTGGPAGIAPLIVTNPGKQVPK